MEAKVRGEELFTCDDLPTPVVIYNKMSGRILKYNQEAGRILDLPKKHPKPLNIANYRLDKLPEISGKKAKTFINHGIVRYRNGKGKEISLQLFRKSINWMGTDCYVDFLEELQGYEPLKNDIGKASLDAFVSIDDNQTILDWNASAEKIFGWKRKDVVGKLLADVIIPPSFRKQHQAGFKKYLKTGESVMLNKVIEVRALHKKGHEFPIELTVTEVEENGSVLFYSFIRDISDRKKAEETQRKLNQSLSDFQNAIQSSSIVSRADKKGIITYVNENFVKISGYSAKELIGQDHHVINSGYHPKSFWKEMWKTIANGNTWRAEVKNKTKDGRYYWVDTFVMPFLDEQGKVKEFLSIRNDITSKKQSEEELTKSYASLSETLIFGKMGSAELDLASLQLTVSRELFQLLDIAAAEASQVPVQNFIETFIHPDYLPIVQQKIAEGLSGARQSKTVVEVDFEMTTATGRKIWIEAKGIFKGSSALGILQDVTDKRKSETELVANSRLINRMLEGITDGFFATDNHLNFTLVNPVFASQANMKPEDMIGKNMLALFPSMEGGNLATIYQEAIASMKSVVIEHRSSSGAEQFFEINVFPNPQGLFVYYKDTSISKKAEKNLRSANELFSRLSENVPGMIYNFQITNEGVSVFPYVSKGSESLFGIAPADLERDANLCFQMVHPDDYPALQASIRKAFYSNQPWSAEFRIVMPDQSIKWISGASNPYLENNETNYWYGFMHDVTDRKVADQRIAESEIKNRLIVENSGEGIMFTEANGRVLSANPEACRIFRMTEEEICKAGRDGLVDMADPNLPALLKIRDEGKLSHGELRMKRKDGSVFIAEVSSKLFMHPKGIANASIIIRDISERKKAEQVREELLGRFKKIAAHVPGVIYQYRLRKDGSSHFPYASEGIIDIYGVQPWEVAEDASKVFKAIHPDDLRRVEILVQKSAEDLTEWVDEYRVVLPSGKTIWLEGHATPQREMDGSTLWHGYISNITSRKLSADLLQQSENDLRAMLNASTDNTVFLDLDGRVRVANAAAFDFSKSVFGNPILLGELFVNAIPDSLQEDFLYNFHKSLQGEIIDFEREIALKSTRIWLHITYLPVKDHSNNIIGVSYNNTDITERKLSETALKESEERFKALYNQTPGMMHSMDVQGRLIRVSDYWLLKMGYSRDEVLGKHVTNFMSPESHEKAVLEGIPNFLRTGKTVNQAYDFVTKTGETLNTLLSANSVMDEEGNITHSMTVITDISDKRKLEKEIEKLAMIASRTSNAVILTDAEGRITWVNESFERITEYTREEVRGKKPREFLQGPDTDASLNEKVSDLLDKGKPARFEILNYSKSGRTYWLDIEIQPIFDEDGNVISFMAIELDITERKISQQKLIESEERFRAVAENMPGSIYQFRLAANGKYSFPFFTEGIKRLLGVEPDKSDDFTDTFGQLIHPQDAIPFFEAVEKSARDLSNFSNSLRVKDTSNNYHWLTARSKPKRLLDGSTVWDGVLLDDTDQKLAEEAIEKANERFVMVTKATNDFIWDWNLLTDEIWWNDNYHTSLDYDSATDVDLNSWSKRVHPEDLKRVMEGINMIISSNQKFWSDEYRFVKNDGTILYIYDRGFVMYDRDGIPYRMIGSMQDITERKKAEEALRKSQLRLQAIFDNAINAMILADDEGNYLDGNPAACKMLECSYQVLTKLNVREVALIETVKVDPFNDFLNKGSEAGTINIRTQSGKIITTQYNAVANILPGLHLSILADITEKIKAETELLKANRIYAVTSAINQIVVRAKSQYEIFSEVCKIAVNVGDFRMAWVGWIDDKLNEVRPLVSDGFVNNYFNSIPAISTLDNPNGRGPSGRAAREGRTIINNDIPDRLNTEYNPWRDQAMQRGYQSSIGLPIYIKGKVMAIFTLYHAESNFFTDKEIKLLEEVTSNIAFGLAAIENERIRFEKEAALKESEELFRALVNDIGIGILLQGPQAEMLLSNQAALDLLGLTENQLLGITSFDPRWNVIHEDGSDFPSAIHPVPQAIQTKKPVRGAVMGVFKPQENERVWLMVDAIPRLDSKGNVINVICTFLDITDKKKADSLLHEQAEEIKKKNEQFISIAQNLPNGSIYQFLLKPDGSISMPFFSDGLAKRLGTTGANIMNDIMAFNSRCHPDDVELVRNAVVTSAKNLSDFRERVGRFKDNEGNYHNLGWYARPSKLDDGSTLWQGVVMDETEQRQAEKNLQLTRFTIDQSSDPILWIRPDASIADINPAANEFLGYSFDEMLHLSVPDIDPHYTRDIWPNHWEELRLKKALHFQSQQKRKDGSLVDVEIDANFVVFEGQEFNCAFIRDITERKKNEAALIASNKEKDLLIKEIHHRVKNNLQLVSSIIYVKMMSLKEGDFKDFLEDTRQKIRSIALMHERLLQTGSVNQVNILDYLGKLIADIRLTNMRSDIDLNIQSSIDSDTMSLDIAIYCGLIINELVTNSIKHAFQGRTRGTVLVKLHRLEGNKYELIVSDDGVSISEDLQLEKSATFGMQMLDIFVKQLKGKIELHRDSGTTFRIVF